MLCKFTVRVQKSLKSSWIVQHARQACMAPTWQVGVLRNYQAGGWATPFKFFELFRIKSEEDKDSVLYEAEGKLNSLKKEVWRYLAIELRGEVTLVF